MNALEILTRHKLEGKTVLKYKGNRAYPKLSKDMGFSPQNLPNLTILPKI
jgi:hypothetical protein